MSQSKRSHEGYLLIDNRNNPGLSDELAQQAGLPPGAGRGMVELPTITCSHCQQVLIVNRQRTRERAYCRKCDHYICDPCGAALSQTGICRPFKQIVDEAQEQAALAEQRTQRGLILPSEQ
jgi:hypothetical protein